MTKSQIDWEIKVPSALWAHHTTYKKVTVRNHFIHLVYGLNVTLQIEFLLPTLKVAKDLKWTTSHELSNMVDELEKLDNLFLLAIACMYNEKR